MLAVVYYVALLVLVLTVLGTLPRKDTALERDGVWFAVLFELFVSAAVCGALVVGFPLLKRKTFFLVGALSGLGLFGGVLAMMHWGPLSIGAGFVGMGMKCFMYGTTFSTIALIALGFISGRLWRKFPDPGLLIAVGVTAVGMSALHFSCGSTDPFHLIGFHLSPMLVAYGVARLAIQLRLKLLEDSNR